MARRRRSRQYGNPVLGSESSEQDQATAWNTAAANQYSQSQRQARGEAEMDDATQSARYRLADLLGYKGEEIPSLEGLKAHYEGLPQEIKAEIYKRGGAPFVGGTAGAKLLAGNAADRETGIDGFTRGVAKDFINGKIVQDADGFHEMVDDPSDPMGKRKMKQKINVMQQKLLEHGFRTGMIPSEKDFNPSVEAPARQMGVEDFEKVLANRRATGGDTAAFQATLDERAADGANPADIVQRLGITNQMGVTQAGRKNDINTGLLGAKMGNMESPQDSAIALRNAIASFTPSEISPRGIAEPVAQFGQDLGNTVMDTGANVVNRQSKFPNWLLRLGLGEGAPQIPRIPLQNSEPEPWMTPVSF